MGSKKFWRIHKIPETPKLNFRVLSIMRKIEKIEGFKLKKNSLGL